MSTDAKPVARARLPRLPGAEKKVRLTSDLAALVKAGELTHEQAMAQRLAWIASEPADSCRTCGPATHNRRIPGFAKCEGCLDRDCTHATSRRINRPPGSCNVCFREPAEENSQKCAGCKAKRKTDKGAAQRSAEHYRRRIAAGLCGTCGLVPFREGYATCQACSTRASSARAVLYKQRIATHLCGLCGNPARWIETKKGGRFATTCESCGENARPRAAELSRRRIANGQCYRCGQPGRPNPEVPGTFLTTCYVCADLARGYSQNKTDEAA